MFIRKKPNASGSLSVQVIQKINRRYKVIKTIGSAITQQEIDKLVDIARQEIDRLIAQPKLFISENDQAIEHAFSMLNNASIRTLEPEIIFDEWACMGD